MLKPAGGIRRSRIGTYWAAALLAVAVPLGGCGVGTEKAPETRYFVIDYALKPEKGARTTPVTVGVDNFRSDSIYRTEKIVFRRVPYQVDFYPYQRWGARPDEIVTDRMIDHLLATGSFREVVRSASGAPSDYLVRGRIKRFEEDNVSNSYFADAQIEVTLIHRRSGKVLLQRRISRRTRARTQPPHGFVNAMAENLKGLLGEASAQIAETVSKHHGRIAKRP